MSRKERGICGYVWTNRQEREKILVNNYRASQTYFGALDCVESKVILKSAKTTNSESTIEFVWNLKAQCVEAKLVLIWDGVSYHRSDAFRRYLEQVNAGEEWKVHCSFKIAHINKDTKINSHTGRLIMQKTIITITSKKSIYIDSDSCEG